MAKLSRNEIDIQVTLRSPSGLILRYNADRILCVPEGMSDLTAIGIVELSIPALLRELWERMRNTPEGNDMQHYDFNGMFGGQQAAVDSVTPSYSAESG